MVVEGVRGTGEVGWVGKGRVLEEVGGVGVGVGGVEEVGEVGVGGVGNGRS